jgi:GAF domain-containing protein
VTLMSEPISPALSRDGRLAQTFVALADTMVADFDFIDLLDRLVVAAVDVLDATAAGLLLDDQRGHLQVMASSSEESRLVEVFQLQNSEGPCLESYGSGRPVFVPDLSKMSDRWPLFVPAAAELGFRSVHALPLRLRATTIGALNIFHETATQANVHDVEVAQALADVATIALLQQRAMSRADLLAEQLQTALTSRIVIEQAKGILAATGSLDMETAFGGLRRFSRNHNLRLSEVARELVEGRREPTEVLGT